MSSLKSTIEGLASQFATSIIEALRSASIAEVMEVTSGTRATPRAAVVSSTPARRGPGRPKKVAAAAPAPAADRPRPAGRGVGAKSARLGRRSASDIGKVIEDIATLLQKHPDGLRAEQIRDALGVQAKELPRPLADGLTQGRFSKAGQKRATTYFAGGAKKAAGGGKKRK